MLEDDTKTGEAVGEIAEISETMSSQSKRTIARIRIQLLGNIDEVKSLVEDFDVSEEEKEAFKNKVEALVSTGVRRLLSSTKNSKFQSDRILELARTLKGIPKCH